MVLSVGFMPVKQMIYHGEEIITYPPGSFHHLFTLSQTKFAKYLLIHRNAEEMDLITLSKLSLSSKAYFCASSFKSDNRI